MVLAAICMLAVCESYSSYSFPFARIECEDGSVKEGNFKVTRMRCWRITVQQVSIAGHLGDFTSLFLSRFTMNIFLFIAFPLFVLLIFIFLIFFNTMICKVRYHFVLTSQFLVHH